MFHFLLGGKTATRYRFFGKHFSSFSSHVFPNLQFSSETLKTGLGTTNKNFISLLREKTTPINVTLKMFFSASNFAENEFLFQFLVSLGTAVHRSGYYNATIHSSLLLGRALKYDYNRNPRSPPTSVYYKSSENISNNIIKRRRKHLTFMTSLFLNKNLKEGLNLGELKSFKKIKMFFLMSSLRLRSAPTQRLLQPKIGKNMKILLFTDPAQKVPQIQYFLSPQGDLGEKNALISVRSVFWILSIVIILAEFCPLPSSHNILVFFRLTK